jgi:hypothetical protein
MTNERTRALLAILCCSGAPLACSGSGSVNIGNTKVVGSQLSDYAATWDGYAEAYTFTPDNSDRVRLTIAANGQGTLQVGNSALLPVATDPNVGYPPGAEDPSYINSFSLGEGVLYPVYGAQVQTNRIQVGIKPNDYYGVWCALQTPVTNYFYTLIGSPPDGGLDGGGPVSGPVIGFDTTTAPPDAGSNWTVTDLTITYGCLAKFGLVSGSGDNSTCVVVTDTEVLPVQNAPAPQQSQPVDCGKYNLCITQAVCGCTPTSCISSPLLPSDALPAQYPVELDAALDSTGKTLTGTLALSTDLRVTVVLTKQ